MEAKKPSSSLRVSQDGKFKDQFYRTKKKSPLSNFLHQRTNQAVGGCDNSDCFCDEDVLFSGYLQKQGAWRRNWKQVNCFLVGMALKAYQVCWLKMVMAWFVRWLFAVRVCSVFSFYESMYHLFCISSPKMIWNLWDKYYWAYVVQSLIVVLRIVLRFYSRLERAPKSSF